MSDDRTRQDDLALKPFQGGDELTHHFLNELIRRIKELEAKMDAIHPEIK